MTPAAGAARVCAALDRTRARKRTLHEVERRLRAALAHVEDAQRAEGAALNSMLHAAALDAAFASDALERVADEVDSALHPEDGR